MALFIFTFRLYVSSTSLFLLPYFLFMSIPFSVSLSSSRYTRNLEILTWVTQNNITSTSPPPPSVFAPQHFTGSPQEERNTAGISVIFTDETRSPDLPRSSVSPRRGGNLRVSAKRQRLSLCGPHRLTKITINPGRERDKTDRRVADGDKDKRTLDRYDIKEGSDRDLENGDPGSVFITAGNGHEERRGQEGVEGGGKGQEGGVDGGTGDVVEKIGGKSGAKAEIGGSKANELGMGETERNGEGLGKNVVEVKERHEERTGRERLETSFGDEGEETTGEDFRDRQSRSSQRGEADYLRSISMPDYESTVLVGHNKNMANVHSNNVQSFYRNGHRSPDRRTDCHNVCFPPHPHPSLQPTDVLPPSSQNGARPGVSRQS